MKKGLLFMDEIDRTVPTAQAAMLAAMREPIFKVSWLRRMWWRVSGRGPRYRLVLVQGKENKHEERS